MRSGPSLELVGRWFAEKFRKSDALIEELADAKVSQQTNTAEKIAREADVLAAERDATDAATGVTNQEEVKGFIENLDLIAKLPPEAQPIAWAKLLAKNPDIVEQMQLVSQLYDALAIEKGTHIESTKSSVQSENPLALAPDVNVAPDD